MKLEPANSDEEPEAAAEAAAPVAVADTAAVAVVEPTPLVKAPATPSAPDPETSRSASSPTLSPTSPAFPELETGGGQDDNDDDCRRRQRRRMAPEAVQGNRLHVLESMTAAIARPRRKLRQPLQALLTLPLNLPRSLTRSYCAWSRWTTCSQAASSSTGAGIKGCGRRRQQWSCSMTCSLRYQS